MTTLTSPAFSAPFLPALGAVVTLAVDYADLHPDSFLNNPAYTGYDGLLTGDQIPYTPSVQPSGNACSLSSDGLITVVGGGSLTESQTFDYALVTAADNYQIGVPAVETLVYVVGDVNFSLSPATETSITSSLDLFSELDGQVTARPITGGIIAEGQTPTAHAGSELVIATTIPVIDTVGGLSKTIEFNGEYTDPIWTASDDLGSLAIVWTGDVVDTSVAGIYTRTVTVTNNIGQAMEIYTVTVMADFDFNIKSLISGVQQNIDAPKTLIKEMLRWSIREFCERSWVWTEELSAFNTVAGESDYALNVVGIDIISIKTCDLGDLELSPLSDPRRERISAGVTAAYSLPKRRMIRLHDTPTSVLPVKVNAVVKIARDGDFIDSDFAEQWFDQLVAGALYKLGSIANKPWTDYAMANFHYNVFRQGWADAKISVMTGNTNAQSVVQPVRMF